MNSRDYKLFRPHHHYHIYNRGDNRENIFLDKQDYLNFLKRLKIVMGIMPIPDAGKRGSLRIRPYPSDSFSILAYCLMPNHFHILIRQNKGITIGHLMNKVCTSYAKYFNHKYKRIGNVYQDTFKAKLVGADEYLSYLSAYINNNPRQPFKYEYSSLSEYVNINRTGFCDTKIILSYFSGSKGKYTKFVKGFTKAKAVVINDLVFDE